MTGSIGLSLKGLSGPGSEFSHCVFRSQRVRHLIQQIDPLSTLRKEFSEAGSFLSPYSTALDLPQLLFSVEKRGSDKGWERGGGGMVFRSQRRSVEFGGDRI